MFSVGVALWQFQSPRALAGWGRGLLLYASTDCAESIHVARAAWQLNRLWGKESTGQPNTIRWMAVLIRPPYVPPSSLSPPTSGRCSQSNASPGERGFQSHCNQRKLMAGDPCGKTLIVFAQTIWWSLWNAKWLWNSWMMFKRWIPKASVQFEGDNYAIVVFSNAIVG